MGLSLWSFLKAAHHPSQAPMARPSISEETSLQDCMAFSFCSCHRQNAPWDTLGCKRHRPRTMWPPQTPVSHQQLWLITDNMDYPLQCSHSNPWKWLPKFPTTALSLQSQPPGLLWHPVRGMQWPWLVPPIREWSAEITITIIIIITITITITIIIIIIILVTRANDPRGT